MSVIFVVRELFMLSKRRSVVHGKPERTVTDLMVIKVTKYKL